MSASTIAAGPSTVLGDGGSAAAASKASPAMRATAEEFESVFVAQILRGLSAGLTGPGPAGGDGPFAEMLQDEYAKLISRSGGIGLADSVLREMLKLQEAS